ncbi:FAD-dependent oxidoreductase [Agrobacterium cavarae]|uniref:FAD-dependent oxidoreductase n=1 Tax=Agrobacterium cavarae TaxID=2528239 RepID=UPI00406D0C77
MQEHHVVVVGGGFGGLQTVHGLKGVPTRITLIDRRNHHLFQPLLYQVATTALSTSEIAWPIRHLFRDRPEVSTLLAEVSGIARRFPSIRWCSRPVRATPISVMTPGKNMPLV